MSDDNKQIVTPDGVDLDSFDEHAWERRTIEDLQEYLSRKRLPSDAPEGEYEPLICEEVPRSRSEVPPHVIHRIINILACWQDEKRAVMNQFQNRRVRLPNSVKAAIHGDSQKPRKKKRKPDPEPTPVS